MNRRTFLSKSAVVLGATMTNGISTLGATPFQKGVPFISNRPQPNERKFVSTAVEQVIGQVKKHIRNPELAWMFENCYPNTIDTTVDFELTDGKPDTYIITGDIDAMWLRDSTAQIWPYLQFVNKEEKLKKLFQGLINRQADCILLDTYANAFFKDKTRVTHWKDDKPTPKPGVHERKWEIDSLCYVVRLSFNYYKQTNDTSIFTPAWDKAMRLAVHTLQTEQRRENTSPYYFLRKGENYTVTASFQGKGRPVKPVGLICSAFRPSDDGTMYPFLIPSNLFAAESLHQLSNIYRLVLKDSDFADVCSAFSKEVFAAVHQYAVTEHLSYGEIYAYEVDGFGNKVFVDDPNVPSLISIPYLLDKKFYDEQVYQNTRRYLLSADNPYYFKGKAGEGQGGPHAGMDTIWPMGIILRAMTSTDENEIIWCIKLLMKTHAGTGFMHETFHKDDATKFSRKWFAWANTLFGELLVKIFQENRGLLKRI